MKYLFLFSILFLSISCQRETSISGKYYPNEFRPELNLSNLSTISVSSTVLNSGDEALINITAIDSFGNPLNVGGSTISLNYEGTGSAFFSPLIDNNNGTYSSTLKAVKNGTIYLKAKLNSSKNSVTVYNTTPITINLGSIDLNKSTIDFSLNSFSIGNTMTFILTLKDLNENIIDDNSLEIYSTLLDGTSEVFFGGVNYIGNGKYQGTITGSVAGTPTKINLSLRRIGSILSKTSFEVLP